MDHSAYIAKTRTLSDAQLLYIIKDAREAIEANPDNPKAGHYADEIHYCAAEIKRRKDELKAALA